MFIARWSIDARFGHKPAVLDAIKAWHREVGAQVGWSLDKVRIASGSIGARESRIEVDILVEDLAALEAAWAKLATLDAHKAWSAKLDLDVVSGSTRWEILRVVS